MTAITAGASTPGNPCRPHVEAIRWIYILQDLIQSAADFRSLCRAFAIVYVKLNAMSLQ